MILKVGKRIGFTENTSIEMYIPLFKRFSTVQKRDKS